MRHRQHLPQLDGGLFLTDGGIETTLIFHEGLDLPAFAAFDLLKDDEGTDALRRYFEPYAALARETAIALCHAELDEATELDEGDPADLGARYAAVAKRLPQLNVLGGCCCTDHRHVREIYGAWSSGSAATRAAHESIPRSR
jgi:S-methylmethionine-dependent homocysteine/selenocysteine methylase